METGNKNSIDKWEIIQGFSKGCDDYLTEPAAFPLLLERMVFSHFMRLAANIFLQN